MPAGQERVKGNELPGGIPSVRQPLDSERTLNHTCYEASEGVREVVGRVAVSAEQSGRPTTSRKKVTGLTARFSNKHNTIPPFYKTLLCSLTETSRGTTV